MALTPEEVQTLKNQLKSQIQHLPEPQKKETEEHINSMSPEAIEEMLQQQSQGKSIFRMIVDKEVKSFQIEENSQAIAVLDINPISKGHALVIPKLPVKEKEKIPPEAYALASDIAKKIGEEFKAQKAEIIPENKFGEFVLHVLPSYESPVSLSSPRSKASDDDLAKTLSSLKVIKQPKIETIKETPPLENQLVKMQRRIP